MRSRLARRWVSIAVIVLAASLTAACGGPPPPTSWSGLTVSGQTAYLAATDRIYALDTDPFTNDLLREQWAFPPAGQNASVTFHSQPALSEDGLLFVGSDSANGRGALFALDTTEIVNAGELTRTVAIAWSYPASENAQPIGAIYGAVAFDGETIYAGTGDGRVVSFAASDAEAGQLRWTYPPATSNPIGRIWSSPVVTGGVVYVASQDHHLYALDAATGSLNWKFEAGAMIPGTPTVHENVVYFGAVDQKLYAVDATTGDKKWEFPAQGWVWEGPTVYQDVLYFGDLNGNLFAVDLSGNAVWSQPLKLEGSIRARPLATEENLFVVTQARKAYAIGRQSQNTEWVFTAPQDGEQLLTTPVLVGDLLLVAPIPSGGTPIRLYAVNINSGNLEWQFPVAQ